MQKLKKCHDLKRYQYKVEEVFSGLGNAMPEEGHKLCFTLSSFTYQD